MKILLVDDSIVIRTHLRAMADTIRTAEVVGEADNATRGIELMRKLKPDVMVLDISLLGSNGVDVLIESRNLDVHPTVAIMTNHPYDAYRRICTRLGADYFFDKSKDFYRLGDVLRNIVERRITTQ